jgi:hypothetical protein
MATETTRQRADLGFASGLDEFNPAEWAPKPSQPPKARPKRTAQDIKDYEAIGFRSREPRTEATEPPAAEKPRISPQKAVEAALPPSAGEGRAGEQAAPRRRRTGRNAQINLKARPETIEAFTAIADRQGWGLGETLEHAVALLAKQYSAKA